MMTSPEKKLSPDQLKLICEYYIKEFDKLPQDDITLIMKGEAKNHYEGAIIKQVPWDETYYYISIFLTYAKIVHSQIPEARQLTTGWYIPSDEIDQQDFAQKANEALASRLDQAKKIVPQQIQDQIKRIQHLWFFKEFNLEYTDERLEVYLNLPPVFLPFDYFSAANHFTKKRLHLPQGMNLRFWKYLKQGFFPPITWSSDRSNNDFKSYAEDTAKQLDINTINYIETLCTHEGVHQIAINPVLTLVLSGSNHCWLNEGIAEYYGDEIFHQKMLEATQPPWVVAEIADTSDKPVNYDASLLLVMALATKLGQGSIDEGITYIVTKLADLALAINQGKAEKIASPLELLYFLDPKLRDQATQEELAELMRKIRDRALAGG